MYIYTQIYIYIYIYLYLFIYYCFCLTTTFARKFLSQKLSASRSLTSSLCAQNAALASSLSLSCFFFFLRLFISFSPSFFFFLLCCCCCTCLCGSSPSSLWFLLHEQNLRYALGLDTDTVMHFGQATSLCPLSRSLVFLCAELRDLLPCST